MSKLWDIILWFFSLFKKNSLPVTTEKETKSVLSSHMEEAAARARATRIREGTGSLVTDRQSGGMSFEKFNVKTGNVKTPKPFTNDDDPGDVIFSLLISFGVFLLTTFGCSLNVTPEPKVEQVYTVERFPVYNIPDRPVLEEIPGATFGAENSPGRQIVKDNFDKLMRWGASLEAILESYNKYASAKNKENPLYKKLD